MELVRLEDSTHPTSLMRPNAKGKPTGQAARGTIDDQRSRTASKAETPPLVRVGLTRLLGTVFCLLPSDFSAVFIRHWRPKVAASGTQRSPSGARRLTISGNRASAAGVQRCVRRVSGHGVSFGKRYEGSSGFPLLSPRFFSDAVNIISKFRRKFAPDRSDFFSRSGNHFQPPRVVQVCRSPAARNRCHDTRTRSCFGEWDSRCA